MARIDLPGDAWAELRDPAGVTERQRRPVMRASGLIAAAVTKARAAGATEDAAFVTSDALEAMEAMNDALVLALVSSWSFETPITLDALLDLPGPAYDALRQACAPMRNALTPNFGPDPDPASPTQPSGA